MWLSKVIAKSGSEDNAMTGITTIGGDNAAVQTDVELRNTVLYSPGGYFWRPKAGQNVLVIKSGDKEVCVSGVRQENFPDDFGRDDICIMKACGGIQSARRLVAQKDFRVIDQSSCNGHSLHLSAGHLVGLFVQLIA